MKHRHKHQRKRAEPDKAAICVVGDAQAHGIALALGKIPELAASYDVVSSTGALSEPDLKRCAYFLQQGEASAGAQRLPRNAKRIVYPKLRFNLLWPLACPNPYNAPEPGKPVGPYPLAHGFILAGAEKGVPPEELLQLLQVPSWNAGWPNLDALFKNETTVLLAADAKAEVKIGSFVLKNFRKQRLFWAPAAPANELLVELAYRLLHACFGRQNSTDRDAIRAALATTGARDVMAHVAVPVHPLVASHFALEWFDKDEQYPYFDATRSFEEYYRGMIDYIYARRAQAQRDSVEALRG
jgi:Polysaccharide biosynthesis enzyme WcbI